MIAATFAFTGISGTVLPSSANPTPEWQGNFRFTLAGTPSTPFDFDVPSGANFCKLFMVENNTDDVATVQVVGGGGDNVPVQIGESLTLYSDGTDVSRTNQEGGTGYIALNLESLREIGLNTADQISNTSSHGGLLTANTTPQYIRVNLATDKAILVSWEGGNVDEVQFPPTFMPPDLDASKDLTIHLLAKMDAGGDVPVINVEVWDAIGDTEMGGDTAALSSTLAEVTRTIVAANISGHPLGFLNIGLIPATHATQAVELYAAWIEYQKVIV